MEYIIEYNFYQDYSSNDFNDKLNSRIKEIQNRFLIRNYDDDQMIKEYFVEGYSNRISSI